MSQSHNHYAWERFSLRTIFLATLGFSLLCGLTVTTLPLGATLAHALITLAFAVPGGSYGHDVTGASAGAAVGTCVAAVVGVLFLSALVLAPDLIQLWRG